MRGPFERANSFFAIYALAASLGNHGMVGLPVYVSRGHGEGLPKNKRSRHRVAHDKRAAIKARNRAKSK